MQQFYKDVIMYPCPNPNSGLANILVKVIHKEDSRFFNQFYPTPCLYHELNMIIHKSYITI